MNAGLVYDGGDNVLIPPTMGDPLPDQLDGTPLENLGELASRICYDSLGLDEQGKRRGRPGKDLHAHILQVKNLSVYEHCNITVRFPGGLLAPAALACANRKGVLLSAMPGRGGVEITANFRAILEWASAPGALRGDAAAVAYGFALRKRAAEVAPRIFGDLGGGFDAALLIGPEELTDDQAWVSLWLEGSRGFTHEQVRHRFAMSQRSTRYVDEAASPYEVHPLIAAFAEDPAVVPDVVSMCDMVMTESMRADRRAYRVLVESLEAWMAAKGVDRTNARKQARGAARGYLGNALRSEMIFSAPVSGWKWILRQRKKRLADAEIREIYSPALQALKASRYGDRFAEFQTVPSPDGIGTVLA